jgi:predicted MFS family arabinose efflux permease
VSWPSALLAVLCVVSLGWFIRVERRVSEPILSLRLFADRTFGAASVLTFLVGFAMFGAVTFLPQYQQNVQGASATSSGLLLLPLLAGMLVTSLVGGQVVARTGRYRGQMIVGAGLVAAGLFLLSTLDTSTSSPESSAYMVVLGVGMGLLMQTTNLVMQNSVARADIGAASGASTLFRTVGGSIGVSLLGVLYADGLTATLTARLGTTQAAQVAGGTITPAALSGLPPTIRAAYQAAVTSGVTTAFLWAGVAALLAVGAAWLVRETPLRGSADAAEATVERAGATVPA